MSTSKTSTRCAYKKCKKPLTQKKFGKSRMYCNGKCKQNHYYDAQPALIGAKRHEHYLKRKAKFLALSNEERANYDAVEAIKRRERYITNNALLRQRSADYYNTNKKKILAKMKEKRDATRTQKNLMLKSTPNCSTAIPSSS